MIDGKTIQRIKKEISIKEVVEEYTTLYKKNDNTFVGYCPFHSDERHTLTVYTDLNYYKCAVCGMEGGPVAFIMDMENVSEQTAAKILADKYHFPIEEDGQATEKTEQERLRDASEWLFSHFRNNLKNTDEGQNICASYYAQKRGFSEATINRFQLGYALENKCTYYLKSKELGIDQQIDILGAFNPHDNGKPVTDRFAERGIFPILSISGFPIAFGGRWLKKMPEGEKKVAKYQNSPNSPLYNKSYTLYGLSFAKKTIREERNCYICEGYCDVISMAQVGIENIVAPCGTALTNEQVGILKRIIPPLDDENESIVATMIYDGDAAGQSAAEKNGKLLLQHGFSPKVVVLPEEDDPDTFAQKHNLQEVKAFLEENTQNFLDFLIAKKQKEAAGNPQAVSVVLKELCAAIALVSSKNDRKDHIHQCSQIFDTKEITLFEEVEKERKKFVSSEIVRIAKEKENILKKNPNSALAKETENTPQPPLQDRNIPDFVPDDDFYGAIADEEAMREAIERGETPAESANSNTPEEVNTPEGSDAPDNLAELDIDSLENEIKPEENIAEETEEDIISPFDEQERRIIFYMLTFYDQHIMQAEHDDGSKEPITAIKYILGQLGRDEIDFISTINRKIKDEITEFYKNGSKINIKAHFLNHSDPRISQITSEILLSGEHAKVEDNLWQNIVRVVLDLKMRVAKHNEVTLREQLMNESDFEKKKELMRKLQTMLHIKMTISNQIGVVIDLQNIDQD